MKMLIPGIVCLLLATCMLHGQVYVQLEKSGSFRTTRFSPGDMLTFRLKNDHTGWHERMIWSVDVEKNKIGFGDVVVPVDSIDAILLDKKAAGAQIIGSALQIGGINMILFTAYDAIFRDTDVDWTAMGAAVLNIGVGTAIKKIFRRAVFRPGPRKRIRLLDLNFQDPNKS